MEALAPKSAAGSAAAASTTKYTILAICCLSLFLVTMDVSIVNVALPSIHADFKTSIAGLQWAIDAYTVALGSFLMLAGSVADRFGRRLTFQGGLVCFGAGSVMCSLAPSIEVLVFWRIVQAVGGSMLNPSAMAIIVNTFHDPKARARAIGLWGIMTGLSMAVGPLLGGLLTQTVGWRWVFAVNVPVVVAAIVLTALIVPESRAAVARRFDPVGQALVIVILGTLVCALIEGPRVGWLSLLGGGAAALCAGAFAFFLIYERKRVEPLIELRFFSNTSFSVAMIDAVLAFTAFGGFLFLNALYLQESRGFGPATAGVFLLPAAAAMIVCPPIAGRLSGAGRGRTAMGVSGTAFLAGAMLLVHLSAETSLIQLFVAYACFGVGIGMANATITNAAVSGMPRAQAGLAAGLGSCSRVIGSAVGVALVGTFARGSFWYVAVACGATIAILALVAKPANAFAEAAPGHG